jgi:hypothetical protein
MQRGVEENNVRPRASMIVVTMAVLSFGHLPAAAAQEGSPQKEAKKVWSDEDLRRARLSDSSTPTSATLSDLQNANATEDTREHYSRTKDPKWYAKQITSLREGVEKIDVQVRRLRESLKTGKGVTSQMVLDQDTPGISPEAQVQVLQERRSQLQRKIDDLEEEARKNDIGTGILRNTVVSDAPVVSSPTGKPDAKETRTDSALKNERERLERIKTVIDLLQRNLDLQTRQIYSNPDARARRSGESTLASLKQEIVAKQQEMEDANEIIASLEDHLEDLKLNAVSKSSSGEDTIDQDESGSAPKATIEEQIKKDEQYWRKCFADAYYLVHMAEKELDALQRELNVNSMQYYADPNKALREQYSRREINAQRQKIEEKKSEIKRLREALSDVEDKLRHAGGDPGWARE